MQRWCYYRVFVYGRRKSEAQFVGRRLGYQKSLSSPETVLFSLYQDQDGDFYFSFGPEEFLVPGRFKDCVEIRCLLCFEAKTREELVESFRRFAKWFGEANPDIPSFFEPLPPIEAMHTITGWDS
jgi:hypothetical protein